MDETLSIINEFSKDVSQASFADVIQNTSCGTILELFDIYLIHLRCDNGNLSMFWMSYLGMIEIFLALVRVSHEGNWLLHLASIRAIIPWCFAYDRLNYARCLPYYCEEMTNLPITLPNVYQKFMQGAFSVQLGSENPCCRIPVDQTAEETANKDIQRDEGVQPEAWILTP